MVTKQLIKWITCEKSKMGKNPKFSLCFLPQFANEIAKIGFRISPASKSRIICAQNIQSERTKLSLLQSAFTGDFIYLPVRN